MPSAEILAALGIIERATLYTVNIKLNRKSCKPLDMNCSNPICFAIIQLKYYRNTHTHIEIVSLAGNDSDDSDSLSNP